MREVMIIIRREFIERVRSRAFVIGTLLFPVFMIAIFLLPMLSNTGPTHRTFVVVDNAPAPFGDRFVETLTANNGNEDRNTYDVERTSGDMATLREQLTERTRNEEIDGFILLSADLLETNTVTYRARNVGNQSVLRDIDRAATEVVQTERLRAAGLDRGNVTALTRRINVDEASITDTGEGRGALGTFFFAYILAFLIYFITAFYGMNVLRSVLEEKTSRIAEVMISSVKSSHLMLGKIVGVGSAALLQVAIWAAFIVIAVTRSNTIEARFGVPKEAFAALTIPVGQGILFVVYFILGFLLFAAMFAAVGAAMTSEQEAQSVQLPIMVPLFVPLLLSPAITGEPLSPLATTLGLIPFTAPITMPMRIASAPIPTIQIIGSLASLVVGLLLVAWLAGKIYRIGILSTGKRPSMAELMRWLREA
jgi:ABC-2 type transport system permease protein